MLCTVPLVLAIYTHAHHALRYHASNVQIVTSRKLVLQTLAKTKLLFVPPNPKLLDIATRTFFCCAVQGTKLKSKPTSGLCRFRVAGIAPYVGTELNLVSNVDQEIEQSRWQRFSGGENEDAYLVNG